MSDDSNTEQVKSGSGAPPSVMAELEQGRREASREKLRQFVPLSGEERALDSGAGTGALALALAPLVREVVAVDIVPELLELGRQAAAEFPNVTFVEGDATELPFDRDSFDLAGCHRTLHHIARPELAVSELARVTQSRRPRARHRSDRSRPTRSPRIELDRFERLPRPLAHPAASGGRRSLDVRHERSRPPGLPCRAGAGELDPYLDLAGCEGEPGRQATRIAPPSDRQIGWYLAGPVVGGGGDSRASRISRSRSGGVQRGGIVCVSGGVGGGGVRGGGGGAAGGGSSWTAGASTRSSSGRASSSRPRTARLLPPGRRWASCAAPTSPTPRRVGVQLQVLEDDDVSRGVPARPSRSSTRSSRRSPSGSGAGRDTADERSSRSRSIKPASSARAHELGHRVLRELQPLRQLRHGRAAARSRARP